jgi:hypothetical protein
MTGFTVSWRSSAAGASRRRRRANPGLLRAGSDWANARSCMPRVVLSVETGTRNAMGLTEYLVVYGTARITDCRAADAPRLGRAPEWSDCIRGVEAPPGLLTRSLQERDAAGTPWSR